MRAWWGLRMSGAVVWVDVEDFLHYFSWNPRPSGIQRLSFELMGGLREALGGRVRFVRHGAGLLQEVGWEVVVAAYRGEAARAAAPRFVGASQYRRSWALRVIEALPAGLQAPVRQAALAQRQAVRQARVVVRAVRQRRRVRRPIASGAAAGIGAGDCLLVLGAPWEISGHSEVVAACKRRFGVSAFLLVYDLIPVRHPEWCTEAATRQFVAWMEGIGVYDGLFAISAHTADDLAAYGRERGWEIGRAEVIPVGTDLVAGPGAEVGEAPGLPRAGSYVLVVCTLEARKNHGLAVRVWQMLAEDVRAGRRGEMPDLVFAGRVGWMVNDLLEQLENTGWLGGRVLLVSDPSDRELRALYAGCQFTLFPSWFEGLGLPVMESLAFGRPCLASDATAIPEAGGKLCRYFSPGDARGAYRAVLSVLDDPAGLAEWEGRIAAEYRRVPWSAAVGVMVGRIFGQLRA